MTDYTFNKSNTGITGTYTNNVGPISISGQFDADLGNGIDAAGPGGKLIMNGGGSVGYSLQYDGTETTLLVVAGGWAVQTNWQYSPGSVSWVPDNWGVAGGVGGIAGKTANTPFGEVGVY